MEVNKIYNENCLEFMTKIPDNFIDLTITSPPYNIGLNYDLSTDSLNMDEYRKWMLDICKELFRVTKIGGRFCFNLGNRVNSLNGMLESFNTIELIAEIIKETKWFLRDVLIWVKTREAESPMSFCGVDTAWGSWLSASNPICRSFSEFIFVFHKQNWKKEPVGESDITKQEFFDYTKNVWYFPAETKRNGHPAPFPYQLPYRCIKLYSYIDDLIFDPFVGTGTTCLVARDLKRNYIGCDKSKKYYNISNGRIAQERLF